MGIEEKVTQTLIIEGTGDTKNAAFADALSKIQGKIIKNSPDVTLKIEPKSVMVLAADQHSYEERFLFIFFPRTRSKFQIKLQVEVEVLTIEMATVKFNEMVMGNNDLNRMPLISKKLSK
ncbi:DUF4312 family protein [Periweissella fabalis]|uniref:DUF4312 family protein n=1 Tax=Periweissella fabalis TaxID=1070421 RepID=A0A7X6N2D9_9LACO|nr:DUF4312 family protein [Periweissella fabalis]MCM0599163.1 DUF4312 family protein [Periweissella fabalis]NKZ23442.1 DUF4312 family protein [Periweissella fabalis]